MIEFMCFLFLSVLTSAGIAITLTEKGRYDWPIKRYRILLQQFIHDKIHYKAAQVLYCGACSSFWISGIIEILFFIFNLFLGKFYFFWPFSGFITLFFVWFIISLLNALEKEKSVNIFVSKENDIDVE